MRRWNIISKFKISIWIKYFVKSQFISQQRELDRISTMWTTWLYNYIQISITRNNNLKKKLLKLSSTPKELQ